MKTFPIGITGRHFGYKSGLKYNIWKCAVQHTNKKPFSNIPMENCRTVASYQNKTDSSKWIPNSPYPWKTFTTSQNNNMYARNYATYRKSFLEMQPIWRDLSSMCHKPNTPEHIQSEIPAYKTSRFCSSSVAHYEPCYIFKYIVHTRVLSRLKIYQTAATILMIPPVVYLNNIGQLSTIDMYAFFGITSVACIMLYVMSLYFRSIVGMLSLCKEDKTVRLSHLTFWGNRKDIYLNADDIVPLMDMSENARKVYAVMKTYRSDKTFIIFFKFYSRLDREQLEEIFGRLE